MDFLKALEEATNVAVTENGAIGYKTTGKALVDFNFRIPSYRDKRNKDNLDIDFAKAWNENKELAIKYLFYLRDIRGGMGERDTFRKCIKNLAIIGELDNRVFSWIMEYGRGDDLFAFFDTPLEQDMIKFVNATLVQDGINKLECENATLLAKWMPSINTSSKKTKALAKRFIKALGITEKEYRKTLAKLRKNINVLEKTLCQGDWKTIEYSKVPSNANLKYASAFMMHDPDGRKAYLDSLKKGQTKINASTVFPHDITHKYGFDDWGRIKAYDETLEQMWKALPNYIQGQSNVMVVRDGSGSMLSTIGNSGVTSMNIADALSIYFAERNSGPYKNKLMTFSQNPQFVDLSGLNTLQLKLKELYHYTEVANTNIEAVFDLVLDLAVKNNLKQEDIPTLLIISDMEFDGCVSSNNEHYCIGDKNMKPLFKSIAKRYEDKGYTLPKLVFWNTCSRTNTIPLTENDCGVVLVSGFSAAITKMVLSNELDPYKALVNEITSKRYEQVTLKN